MHLINSLICFLACFCFLFSSCDFLLAADAELTRSNEAGFKFFETKIRPVLYDHCQECHSEDSAESGLRLDSPAGLIQGGERGAAIVPGDPQKSLLISAINHGEILQMPEKEKLPPRIIADLTAWVKMGAPWPGSKSLNFSQPSKKEALEFSEEEKSFWAFQPPRAAELPSVKNVRWIKNSIDQFLLAELERHGLRPAPPADRRVLLRRATYDLIGLPPTPAEIKAFLADTSEEAFAKVVDRLLASPHYGERWGRHWLDVARYADSNGMDENMAFEHAFRYRDYVISAMNLDKPYDRFVQEQIAGDLLPKNAESDDEEELQKIIATGFLAIGPKMLADDDPLKKEMDIIDEQLATTSRAFMALTLECGRCHDHKFDPLPQADYYSLAGLFKSTRTMDTLGVVAQWHENDVSSAELKKQIQMQEEIIKQAEQKIKQRIEVAQNDFLKIERSKSAKYLLAAADYISQKVAANPDGKTSIGDAARPESIKDKGVILEAENYQRGNFTKDNSRYGRGIGIIHNSGFAEYEFQLPNTGQYQLEIRYASADTRPIQLSINGVQVKKKAARQTTGGYQVEHQAWHVEGVFDFQVGKNILRMQSNGAIPHLDKLLLLKMPRLTDPESLQSSIRKGREKNSSQAVFIEAEKYNRGTFRVIGPFIQNGGDGKFQNEAEYDVEIPRTGNYQLELLYASGARRHVRLLINDQLVLANAGNRETGSFDNSTARWFPQAIYRLAAGRLTIRLEKNGVTPHIDRLALVPTDLPPTAIIDKTDASVKTVRQLAQESDLHQEILRQWIAFLRTKQKNSRSIRNVLLKTKKETAENRQPELIERLQFKFMQAGAEVNNKDSKVKISLPEREALQAALFDKSGPFRLPRNNNNYFSKSLQAEIKLLTKLKDDLVKAKPQPAKAMGVTEGKIQNVKIHLRGSHLTLGREVPRRFLSIIAGKRQTPIGSKQSGRLEFANWLTDGRHPLTARVMVNRIWRWHFGTGLVRSPDNFGRLGKRPTNQALLDWLAVEFVRRGWSIKKMHRLMMLSSAYQMSTEQNAEAKAADPENKLYWQMNRRRMDAEEVRDSLLALGDALDPTMGGQLMDYKNRAYVTGTGSKISKYDIPRRSVYLPILRSAVYEVFQAFDFADPSVLNGRRAVTTVPPQALFMMNSNLVSKHAMLMAEGLIDRKGLDDRERIELAYEKVYGRLPNTIESNRFLEFIKRLQPAFEDAGQDPFQAEKNAWRSLCRVLIGSNEFIYIE